MPDATAPAVPRRTHTQTANTAQKETGAYFYPTTFKSCGFTRLNFCLFWMVEKQKKMQN